ncbi:MAG TPA: DNA polymerase III subunit alpha, partial [Thermoanaerobaculia bacterium]|nr:DNA polymerase III subunit alpha [Thermoanaerobaculia bacterium]
ERLAELRRRQARGVATDAPAEEIYRERLERELEVIVRMGFPGYFLVVWDFCRHARDNGIPVGPGRGSAAGSLVSFSLRITDVDPLQYGLLFERFLNPDRISMPDIDIDFCMRRRGEVINYVSDKYGRDKVAQIITFGTLAARAVIRDVGRVMGLPYGKVDRVAKMIPEMTGLEDAIRGVDALQAEIRSDPEVKQVVDVGRRLEGLSRHAGMHAAGVVIAPRPIQDLVPLCKTNRDEVITQWDKDVIEELGLLKMDFLGLRTLTVIDDTLKFLRLQGIDIDLAEIPLDDPEVYRLFQEGRTNGIFQFESSGMKDMLRRAGPTRFMDLSAFNALYRPGALSVGMVEEFIKRKRGERKVQYILPETKPILEETYGVIAYQEQVMRVAVEVAGFTMAEADVLRKAMGKKKLEVMVEQKQKFIAGAKARGKDGRKAEQLWDTIEPFAGYGFNKSHSVAYAMLAYRTAYLKAHYPVAFMAAMLNSELSSSDSMAKYLGECRNMGIRVLPPDVNESDYYFTVVGDYVRFGLGGVKGVGENAVEDVLAARRRLGRFQSIAHVAAEIDGRVANRKVFECLVKAGAFDGVGPHRAAHLAALDRILDYAQRKRQEREAGQSSLFGGAVFSLEDEPRIDTSLPPWSERELLSAEKETLGLYLSGNPLREHEEELARQSTHTTADLKEGFEGEVTLGGLVTQIRKTKIKNGPNAGKFMGRFVLEDLHGSLAVTLFANQLQQYGHLLAEEAVVVVKGEVRERGSDVEMTVLEIVPLALGRGRALGVDLLVPPDLSQKEMLRLRDLLIENPGEIPVTLELRLPEKTFRIRTQESYSIELRRDLVETIESLLGSGAVKERFTPASA